MTGERVASVHRRLKRIGRWLFADRVGFALFLGALCFVLLSWRTGIVINDNVTLRETLAALADGRAWIEPATGDYLRSPGTGVRYGYVYGRNYGQLVLSLPALWALQALDAVANLHVALTALFHLVVLAFVVQVGKLFEYQREAAFVGSGLVLVSFLVNLGLATVLSDPSLPLLALQVTTAVVAAFASVILYRLVARREGHRLGVLAGAGLTLATPIGFWALVPKRHVFSVGIVVGLLYTFARSRESDAGIRLPSVGTVPAYRAAAYALVGLLTWINAEEGVYVFLALVLVDVPTAPSNDRRSLAFVTAVFVLSLVPFFVTNLFVTGKVMRPPRSLLGGFFETGGGGTEAGGAGGGSGGGGGGGGGSNGGTSRGVVDMLAALLPSQFVWIAGNVVGSIADGVNGVLHTENMYHTLVHSSVESVNEDLGFRGVNLSVLESMPILGTLVAGTVAGGIQMARTRTSRLDATDMFALALVLAFVIIKAGRLPLRVQITVRYLLPIYALGLFLLVRGGLYRTFVGDHRGLLYWAYGAGVCIGGQLLLTWIVLSQFSVGEATRVHALLGVGLGAGVAVCCLGGVADRRLQPIAAVALGLAAAAGTVFVLLAGLYYFSFTGDYILPVVELVSDRLTAAG